MISRQIQPPWDAAAALETFMGDTAVLQRVMSRFCTRLPGQVEELKSFIYREEWEHAGILAHGLKGSAWNLSCGVLGKLAQRIEESCHAGKLTPTEDEVSQLSLEADRVISYVKSTSFRPIKEDDSA
jgi:HPt (histidine-containing phosphotransfer) domain-containing protein